MKQTSVEWLEEKLNNLLELYPSQNEELTKLIQQAKEMHKKEIIEAYWDGNQDVDYKLLAEQYYNKTFKTK